MNANGNYIKPLKSNFRGRGEVKGYQFALLGVTNRAFLYEVREDGIPHYEVFKKRINARFGTYSYPSSKLFGISAWTYTDLKRAIRKYNELNFSHE